MTLLVGRWKGNQPNWLSELELLDALAEVVVDVAAVFATIVVAAAVAVAVVAVVAAAAEPAAAAARVALG